MIRPANSTVAICSWKCEGARFRAERKPGKLIDTTDEWNNNLHDQRGVWWCNVDDPKDSKSLSFYPKSNFGYVWNVPAHIKNAVVALWKQRTCAAFPLGHSEQPERREWFVVVKLSDNLSLLFFWSGTGWGIVFKIFLPKCVKESWLVYWIVVTEVSLNSERIDLNSFLSNQIRQCEFGRTHLILPGFWAAVGLLECFY